MRMSVIELSMLNNFSRKMAAFSTFHHMLITFGEILDDDDFWYLQTHMQIELCSTKIVRRDSAPKVSRYMESVFALMDVPQNVYDFRSHFRVNRSTFDIILQDIYHSLILKGKGQHETVSPDKQLAVCLWYLANQESMREVAHLFGLSKSTVHGIIMKVCHTLMDLGSRVIVWPSARRQREIAHDVEEICKLPGVIGFLDGSHIRLSSILNGDRDFYNRKGFPSMQLQAVVDHEMKFTNVFTGWPGCVHDARVLRNSKLFVGAEAGELIIQDHSIFADNAYPLRNWLVTPFKNFGNLTPQQVRFNKRLSMVKQTIERAFGHLKGRFRRLQSVPLHSCEEVCKLIYCACILHNLCIANEDDVEQYIFEHDEQNDPNHCENIYQNGHNGVLRRLRLVNIV